MKYVFFADYNTLSLDNVYFKIEIVPGLCKHYCWDWVLLDGFDFILWILSRIYIKIMKIMKIVCECT